jgi:metal-responsive CopG/Arc/MetJ family transcriptional regulator
MKTAVSLPDDLFQAADTLARKLGMTRSGLFATAVADYIARHRNSRVTERLNAVYATEDNSLDEAWQAEQDRMLRRSEW